MTWIKPSFLWMMYRCGWGGKTDQETVLAVEITREGFDRALRHACLSHHEHGTHPDVATWKRALRESSARVQWDPERDLHLNPLRHRSLQLGLSGPLSRAYADEWTVAIRDVTPQVREIHGLVRAGEDAAARALIPAETPTRRAHCPTSVRNRSARSTPLPQGPLTRCPPRLGRRPPGWRVPTVRPPSTGRRRVPRTWPRAPVRPGR